MTKQPCPECGRALTKHGLCSRCLKLKPRVIVCAANRSRTTGKIICGARHWDRLMRAQIPLRTNKHGKPRLPKEWVGAEQGFVDQFGNFLSRQQAYRIAKANGQIKWGGFDPGTLYSEDLY